MHRKYFPVLIVSAFLLSPSWAGSPGSGDRWLHVKVDENRGKGETVRVNIPLGLVEEILPFVHIEELRNGKLQLDDVLSTEVDIRGVLEAVRNAEDAEFVTVDSEDESVRVAKSGEYLLVHVFEDDGEETVNVKLPLRVVDALLSGGEDELDLAAAIRVLGEYAEGDLVTVRDRHTYVRVWIDSRNTIE